MSDSAPYAAAALLRLGSDDRHIYFCTMSHTRHLTDFPEDDTLFPLEREECLLVLVLPILMADEGVSLDSWIIKLNTPPDCY